MIDAATVHSIYLQTFWKLSENAHAPLAATHASTWLWEFVKGAGMYPIFINEMRFWYLLRCCCVLIYFFFWQVEHSGSLWRVCGLCACCGLWEHCDVTVFSMMRSKKWCFWRLLGKKWNFSLKNSCFRLRVRRRRNRLAFPDISLWLKHFFLGIAAHRAAWNLNIVTNSLNNTVMRWERWARPKWLLSGIGAINTTSQCHSQARRLLS